MSFQSQSCRNGPSGFKRENQSRNWSNSPNTGNQYQSQNCFNGPSGPNKGNWSNDRPGGSNRKRKYGPQNCFNDSGKLENNQSQKWTNGPRGSQNWSSGPSRPKRKYEPQQNNPRPVDKYSVLISEVQKQGPLGKLILFHNETVLPYVNLQNSLINLDISLTFERDISQSKGTFVLKLDNTIYASGKFDNPQIARTGLAQETWEKLKTTCFFIERKRHYTDVTNEALCGKEADPKPNPESTPVLGETMNDVAHKMMLKMGWSGKGLGASEQGRIDPVPMYENIRREGLGSSIGNKDIMKEIMYVLDDFSRSDKFTTLAFDSNFTKEERAHIHKLANRNNLKSKSEGQGDDRRITVSRKIGPLDLVRHLLKIGGENESYRLHVPTNYRHLLESGPKQQ